jgi:hypothetical protein
MENIVNKVKFFNEIDDIEFLWKFSMLTPSDLEKTDVVF